MTEEPSLFLPWDPTKLNFVEHGPKAAQLGVGDDKQELTLPQACLTGLLNTCNILWGIYFIARYLYNCNIHNASQ